MNDITLDEVKKLELDILRYLHEVCEKINARYFLAYGTLLGAVRHSGFIPWDDDVDVWMPREDYNLLISYLTEHNDGRYRLYSPNNKDDYYICYAKLIDNNTVLEEENVVPITDYGLFVDIFPLDYYPNNNYMGNIFNFIMNKLNLFRSLSVETEYRGDRKGISLFARNGIKKLCIIYGFKRIIRNIEWLRQRIYVNHKNFTVVYSINKLYSFNNKWFKYRVKIKFEDEWFWAPGDYDSILTKIYGNYMKLPSIEKRISNHNFIVCKYKDIINRSID